MLEKLSFFSSYFPLFLKDQLMLGLKFYHNASFSLKSETKYIFTKTEKEINDI